MDRSGANWGTHWHIYRQKMKIPELNTNIFNENFSTTLDKFIAVKMLGKTYPQILNLRKVFARKVSLT